MGAGDIELLDLLVVSDSDDEPRLKVGDAFSNKGIGADCAYLATDGFISQPNGQDPSGGAGQAIVWTSGNDRFVIAAMDGRYNDKAGTLQPGDRAIVSNCDAALLLSQSNNLIELLASAQGMSIALNASTGHVTLTNGTSTLDMFPAGGGPPGTSLVLESGSVTAEIEVSGTSVRMSYANLSGAASIAISSGSGGRVDVTAPGGLWVNGVLVVVP